MHSSFIFYILVTTIILVRCQEYYHKEQSPHKFVEKDCHASRGDIRKNVMETNLKPRERHVTLIPESGFKFFPRTVSVKRCNGYCFGGWAPEPATIVNKQFMVRLHTKANPRIDKCAAVIVEEHLQCRCKCLASPSDCKPSQKWVQETCRCECTDYDKILKCESQYGMVWFHESCSCGCTDRILPCPSSQKWAKEVCGCKCINSSPDDCKPSQTWVENSCSCECEDRKFKKYKCKSQYGMIWFDEDCSCACTDKILSCQSGLEWDREFCRCMPQ